MATKRPARFIDEDNYDSSSSTEDPSLPSQPPSKKYRAAEWRSPTAAGDLQPNEPATTPSPPQAPTDDEQDEPVEEQPETQAASTKIPVGEIAEEDRAAASGADVVEEATASEKNTSGEPAAESEAEEAERGNEDRKEAEDRGYLFGPSEDGDGKKSVNEELPWIKAALEAAGLDADGNEIPPEPEPEPDY